MDLNELLLSKCWAPKEMFVFSELHLSTKVDRPRFKVLKISFFVPFHAVAFKTKVGTLFEGSEFISPTFPYHWQEVRDAFFAFAVETPHWLMQCTSSVATATRNSL